MKQVLLAMLMLVSINVFAQYDLDVSIDRETGDVIYKGQCTFADLNSEQAFGWLRTGVGHYKPDEQVVRYLTDNLPDHKMVVLMGTWCEDSQEMLPQIYKILRLTGFPMQNYTMYGLDMEKKGYKDEHTKYNVSYVPTVILFKGGKEIGRIVETVQISLEADLKDIIEKHKAG